MIEIEIFNYLCFQSHIKNLMNCQQFFFLNFIRIKIYIDNSKVEEKDERSFPQSTKPDQSKTILLYKEK